MITYNFLVKKVQVSRISFTWKARQGIWSLQNRIKRIMFQAMYDHLQLFIKKKTILGISFTICQLFKSPGYCRGSYKKHIAVIFKARSIGLHFVLENLASFGSYWSFFPTFYSSGQMLHKQIWREKTLPGGSEMSWSLVNDKQTNSSDILISMNLHILFRNNYLGNRNLG